MVLKLYWHWNSILNIELSLKEMFLIYGHKELKWGVCIKKMSDFCEELRVDLLLYCSAWKLGCLQDTFKQCYISHIWLGGDLGAHPKHAHIFQLGWVNPLIPHVEREEGKMLEMDGVREDKLVTMTVILVITQYKNKNNNNNKDLHPHMVTILVM